MRRKRHSVAHATLTATAALGVSLALEAAGGNSCILSGSTERSCATTAWAEPGDLEARSQTRQFDEPLAELEARVTTKDFGAPLDDFCSEKPVGTVIIVR